MPENKYRILDPIEEGVQIIGENWEYLYINHTAARQGKTVKEHLLGRSMIEMFPGIENTEMFSFLKRCMTEHTSAQLINEFDFPDGSKGYFELRMQRIDEGVLIFSFDVTQQKLTEKLLYRTNEMLEDKVKQRTVELSVKNKELEQFTFIASHDLQEPLRTIQNYISLFVEDYQDKLDDTAHGYLTSIHKAVSRMNMLIIALLDLSCIGKGSHPSSTNLNHLLNEVIADLDSAIQSSGAVVNIGVLPVANIYEIEMRQLFQNLISNAIKFRRKDIPIEISVQAKDVGTHWQISVADNGIGINPQYFEKIFQIFQRLHLSVAYEGNGIGLANCKKIIELHNGEIWAESTSQEGSNFIFTIDKSL